MGCFGGPGEQLSTACEITPPWVVRGSTGTLRSEQCHESSPQPGFKLPPMVSDYCGGSAKTGDPPLNEGLCHCICTESRDGEGFQPPRESVHAHQKVRESTG